VTQKKSVVSVIIPVYNCERYLGEAIESVLAQTCGPLEIIVVDDGSTDHTADVARSFAPAVRYFLQAHAGAPAARNRGAELARGCYIAYLDADDLWVGEKLERQIDSFDEDPELDMVCGCVEQFVSPDVDEEWAARIHCPDEAMRGPGPLTMLIREEALRRVGLFETRWKIGESISWYARAMELGLKTLMLPDAIVRRRLHRDNMSVHWRDTRSDYLHIVKEALDRRRKGSDTGDGKG